MEESVIVFSCEKLVTRSGSIPVHMMALRQGPCPGIHGWPARGAHATRLSDIRAIESGSHD
jgi:hypothetical protein